MYSELVDNSEDMFRFDDLDRFFDLLPLALYRSGPNGELQAANQALADLLGFESVSALLSSSQDVADYYVEPDDREGWLSKIAADGVAHEFDVELRRADDSTIWVRDSARVVTDDEGEIVCFEGALVDVTDKIRIQQSRARFVAAVSHELRNPITVIVGLSEELIRGFDEFDEDEKIGMIGLIAQEADEAAWLIKDLLVAHRGDLSTITLAEETFDVADEIRRLIDTGQFDVAVDSPGETTVVADPGRTRQILRNLLTNARRYGGKKIAVEIEESDQDIFVMVCDSGSPIPEEYANILFEPYGMSGVNSDSRSVGIGLSVSQRLARRMGGDLEYRHDGARSCFTLRLPKE